MVFILVFCSLLTHAQTAGGPKLPTLGVLLFETSGSGVSVVDAGEATRLVLAELRSWGTVTILEGTQANSGDYLVKGSISRQNNQIVLSAVVSDTKTGKNLNTAKEQAPTLDAISMTAFCAKITENVPFPNYLVGKWRSTINMADGPVTCILEFLSDRTVKAVQYDTWEHNGTNILKYQGFGTGSYSYAGYLRRTVVLGGREIRSDATVGINLKLEDALSKYTTVNAGGIRLLFDESKSSFELVYGAFPCGDNYSGPSVYPSERVYYTKFFKIQ